MDAMDEDDAPPFSAVINGVEITDHRMLEALRVLHSLSGEFINRDDNFAEENLGDNDYMLEGDDVLNIINFQREAIGLTEDDSAFIHRLLIFIGGLMHFAHPNAGNHLSGTMLEWNGGWYLQPLARVNDGDFMTTLWNGREINGFGHVQPVDGPPDEDEEEIWSDGNDDNDDDDNDDGDDPDDRGQGAGLDDLSELPSRGWGQARPIFGDLLQEGQETHAGEGSREERPPPPRPFDWARPVGLPPPE